LIGIVFLLLLDGRTQNKTLFSDLFIPSAQTSNVKISRDTLSPRRKVEGRKKNFWDVSLKALFLFLSRNLHLLSFYF
jgi:hypothetical protein